MTFNTLVFIDPKANVLLSEENIMINKNFKNIKTL